MISSPRLSICIPTFNRLDFLRHALGILLPQAEFHGVEVCISDNHSTDGTAQFLKELTKQGNHVLKYVIQPQNIGLDGNMFAVISMASGEYVYPLGDDDILPEGKLKEILRELENGSDLLILNGWHTDSTLVPLRRHLSGSIPGRSIDQPDQAFIVLWDKMPFGSFIASRECFSKKYFYRYMGTSHAYAGAVWDALADKAEIKGGCVVRCMEAPTVLLRGAEKTWQKNAAQIMLIEIPCWFDLISKKCIYNAAAQRVRRFYLKNQTSFFSLAHFCVNGQLGISNFSALSISCTRIQKLKMNCVARAPIPALEYLIKVRSILKNNSL